MTATIQLSDTVALYGTVTDDESNPLEGVAVNLYYYQQSIQQTTTDSNGEYNFPAVAAGSYGINFYKNLYGPLTVFQTISLNGSIEVNPTLFPVGGILTGTVFSSIDALPLAGAAVVLSQENNASTSFTTSANGEFTFLNVPSGLNILNVTMPNFETETATINLQQSAIGSIDFTLFPTSSTINGSVLSSGEPIEGLYSVYQENFPDMQ